MLDYFGWPAALVSSIRNIHTARPLMLSFSPWEKGRLNRAPSAQHRPLSQRERERVRGGDLWA
jgi:hypothetical protein